MNQALWRQVVAELRWSFTPPWIWLTGVALNLALSLVWLAAEPLNLRPHTDLAIVVGSYFAVFILADVTTTNVLGADAQRVRQSMVNQVSLRRILLLKNLTLLIIVGLPTLIVTAILTVTSEADHRVIVTLPGVAFPIMTWLGVGNIVSVALPVAVIPIRERWEQRRQLRSTARWLTHLVLPYALYLAVDPVSSLPRFLISNLTPFLPRTEATRGAALCLTGLTLWGVGTAVALAVARLRDIRLDQDHKGVPGLV
jgi:hypothetical protein